MPAFANHDLALDLIFFQSVILLIILSNLFILRGTRKYPPLNDYPLVSVLVPARNEEKNIERCVRSLLGQQYPSFEVLVLDDHSTDSTLGILTRLSEGDSRLKILTGQSLQAGWFGKSWACAQLAEQAKGHILLFTDADTHYHPLTLDSLVTAMAGEQADVLTGFPRQEMHSWGERLLVPFFSWAFFSFTPLALAYRLKAPFLSSAVGQMMLFRRSAYQAIGGHASVRDQIAEDLGLARQAKTAGLRWRVIYLTDLISSRMYTKGRQAFDGFSKNFFAAFDNRLLPYLFVFGWLAVMFWYPPVELLLALLGYKPGAHIGELLTCIFLSLLLWIIPYAQLGFGIVNALLYPVTIIMIEGVALNSLWLTLTGRLSWKGRALGRQRWRLI